MSEPNHKKRKTDSSDDGDYGDNLSMGEEKTPSKCKAQGIPIFLKKTYKMIDSCEEAIAAWTADGDMFVVKDPERFAAEIIPQYFDHNKFSSFARQLNFYGFRKMQSKPIRNSDFDSNTAKHVTFYNENFKKGRCDLLKNITRSTRGGNNTAQDQQREVQTLKEQVFALENKVTELKQSFEERMRRLELDMLGRMEQMMLAMAQQQQNQMQLHHVSSIGGTGFGGPGTGGLGGRNFSTGLGVEPLPFAERGASTASLNASMFAPAPTHGTAAASVSASTDGGDSNNKVQAPGNKGGGPTLPPHPKQKPLPPSLPPHPKQQGVAPPNGGFPGSMGLSPQSRFNSLARGLSRGLSNLSRGVSAESSASAALLRNSWEDKFFSMLMLEGNGAAAQNAMANVNMAATGQGNGMGGLTASDMQNFMMNNPALSARAFSIGGSGVPRFTSDMSAITNPGTGTNNGS